MKRDYDELKKFQRDNSTSKPTAENTLEIKLTFSRYTNYGYEYYQEKRYINPSMAEEMELEKCDKCGILMDGGYIKQSTNEHTCYACHNGYNHTGRPDGLNTMLSLMNRLNK